MGVNYGLERVRFPAPVVVGQRIRARRTLAAVELVAPLTLQQRQVISIEIEGGPKPACVAEILMRMFFVD
jgi:acyl dehydratase